MKTFSFINNSSLPIPPSFPPSQNELILATVLDAFHDAISMLLRYVPPFLPSLPPSLPPSPPSCLPSAGTWFRGVLFGNLKLLNDDEVSR